MVNIAYFHVVPGIPIKPNKVTQRTHEDVEIVGTPLHPQEHDKILSSRSQIWLAEKSSL